MIQKSNVQLILEYLHKHNFQARIICYSIFVSAISNSFGKELSAIIKYIFK